MPYHPILYRFIAVLIKICAVLIKVYVYVILHRTAVITIKINNFKMNEFFVLFCCVYAMHPHTSQLFINSSTYTNSQYATRLYLIEQQSEEHDNFASAFLIPLSSLRHSRAHTHLLYGRRIKHEM